MRQDWLSRFSDNIRGFEGYSIGKLFKLLDDPEIISLAGGLPSPEMFAKEEMQLASKLDLRDNVEKIMQYSATPGEKSLIEAVIQFLEKDNIRISEENIVITSSGQQGLDLAGRLFLDPGDVIIIDRPTFAGAIVAFQMERPIFVGVNIEKDGSDVDGFRERLEDLERENRRPKFIYVVPDFQNPTGITMSLEKRRALLDLSYHYDVPIIEDSPYRHLRYYGQTASSIFSLDQEMGGGHVIGLYTFSKLFCPGMRVGFNIGPRDVIEQMTNIKEGSVLTTPKYNQDMCTAFLTEMDSDSYFEKCRNYYREKLQLFLDTMAAHFPNGDGFSWTEPEGGLFLWVTVPDSMDTLKLLHQAIKFKVAFVPGNAFYAENHENNHMRINFSYPSKEQLVEAVMRLARFIEEYRRQE
jgi:2-aminoadipate transaminase